MGKLRNTLAAISILLLASCGGNKDYYMFTSFHEPADEGLRYLYSEDGMHWDSIPGVWLKPELGQHRLMRDPSMVRTPDGTYHLVWTTSWKGDLGFGYAPVAVETVRAHAGLDIGGTLIGMHLRPVAVPVRLSLDHVGKAVLLCARTRPKFIGGGRACYVL